MIFALFWQFPILVPEKGAAGPDAITSEKSVSDKETVEAATETCVPVVRLLNLILLDAAVEEQVNVPLTFRVPEIFTSAMPDTEGALKVKKLNEVLGFDTVIKMPELTEAGALKTTLLKATWYVPVSKKLEDELKLKVDVPALNVKVPPPEKASVFDESAEKVMADEPKFAVAVVLEGPL